jgi:hypothetical protein
MLRLAESVVNQSHLKMNIIRFRGLDISKHYLIRDAQRGN